MLDSRELADSSIAGSNAFGDWTELLADRLDHQVVLVIVLPAAQQFLGQPVVLIGRLAAAGRTGQRLSLDSAARQRDKGLGGRTQERPLATLSGSDREPVAVGIAIVEPRKGVRNRQLYGKIGRQRLREDDFPEIAGLDIGDGVLDLLAPLRP